MVLMELNMHNSLPEYYSWTARVRLILFPTKPKGAEVMATCSLLLLLKQQPFSLLLLLHMAHAFNLGMLHVPSVKRPARGIARGATASLLPQAKPPKEGDYVDIFCRGEVIIYAIHS